MNVLIYPAELADALDEIPELARGAEFHGLALDPWSQDLAAPLADMMLDRSDGQRRIVVTVSPRFSITCFPDAATCLKIDIRRTLLGHCRGLAKSLKDGLYDLTVHLEQDGARLRPFTAS
jgi:hypothetical protein